MMAKLDRIIKGLPVREILGDGKVSIEDISSDSRRVTRGGLFACVRGGRVDGHDFAGDAAGRGAAAILAEHRVTTTTPVTQIIVDDVRAALAFVASRFYREPSRDLTVVGITGTNGKTTTVGYLRSIIAAWGQDVGTLGTLGHWIGDSLERDPFTTPESPQLQRYLRLMVDRGVRYCVMEVSSHAIALRRADHVEFDVVGFTNISRDHLDFHHDFEEYRKTKMKLFGISDEGCFFGDNRKAVVNLGDDTGRTIAGESPLECLTYRLANGREVPGGTANRGPAARPGEGAGAAKAPGQAHVRGRVLSLEPHGTTLEVTCGGESRRLQTSLPGRMNAENALAACALAVALGIDARTIAAGIESLEGVPGRMEIVDGPGRQAIVDYAHTPDALSMLLEDVRRICTGRLICVFGCGGDRDAGKRPEMAAIAGSRADVTIVTSDNPRTEDPLKIIDDIVAGLPQGAAYEVIPDRAEAIKRAVALSREKDIIVIAGKGHEDYQIIGITRRRFDDRETVRKAFGVIADARA